MPRRRERDVDVPRTTTSSKPALEQLSGLVERVTFHNAETGPANREPLGCDHGQVRRGTSTHVHPAKHGALGQRIEVLAPPAGPLEVADQDRFPERQVGSA